MCKVSVLMPLYKAEKFIGETIESVLAQSFEDWELIIVDDCGGDNSLNIARNYQLTDARIKIYCNTMNRGIAYTRNQGLKHCSGEYIALLDDDDLMTSDRLEKQVRYMDEHMDIAAVGGNAQWVDENGKIIRGTIDVVQDPAEIKMFLCFRNILNNSEMTVRRTVIQDLGISYQDNGFGMEDFRFWIELSKKAKITNLKDLVLQKRVIISNETAKMKTAFAGERAEKFLELQLYSLRLGGVETDADDEDFLRKYMGEEHYVCNNYDQFSEYITHLTKLKCKIKEVCTDIYPFLSGWFDNCVNWQIKNVCDAIGSRTLAEDDCNPLNYVLKRVHELENWAQELEEGKSWLEGHCAELEDWIRELEEGKNWLEGHCAELEDKVKTLEKRKR